MSLLKLTANPSNHGSYQGIKSLLTAIIRDHGILQLETHPSALDALIASLQACPDFASGRQLEFLDDCCNRFVKKSIKYQDDFDAMVATLDTSSSPPGPFSLLLTTLMEQWAYKAKAQPNDANLKIIGHWLSRFIYLLKKVGEDGAVLQVVIEALANTSDKTCRKPLKDALSEEHEEWAQEFLQVEARDGMQEENSKVLEVPKASERSLRTDLEMPPVEDQNHAGLDRWRRKDLDESLEDGDVGELLLCLCSQHISIRLQAVTNIKQLIAKIEVGWQCYVRL
jgi:nucleolar pre-ribosomal-associated protein 1